MRRKVFSRELKESVIYSMGKKSRGRREACILPELLSELTHGC